MVTGLDTVSIATIMRRTVLQQHKKGKRFPGMAADSQGSPALERTQCGWTKTHCGSSRLILVQLLDTRSDTTWRHHQLCANESYYGFVVG